MKYNEENPLRVFTTFSGYDSQCLALKKANIPFELVGWSEIEKRAIDAHNVLFPESSDKNYGDICKIDWEHVPDFDFFTYSSPCFVAGTQIQTKQGLKNIEDIEIGDEVLTHTNTYHRVVTPMKKTFSGELYHIKSANGEIVCTPEHPFYIRELTRQWNGEKYIRCFDNPVWKEAKYLKKGYYLGTPVNQESKFPDWNGVELHNWGHNRLSNMLSNLFTSQSFWYLMGRYIGDGWCGKNIYKPTGKIKSRWIIICCSKKKVEDKTSLISAIENCGFHYNIIEERTVFNIRINSKELWSFVQRYGSNAYGKFIDLGTLNLPVEYLKSFVEGYIDSDGYQNKTDGTYGVTTVSKKLAYTFGQAVNKVYRRAVRICFNKLPETHVIEGRTVNQRSFYTVRFKKENTKQDQSFYENGYIWSPINTHKMGITTECVENCDVYNMEVENDNSYVANNYIVHNCQSFSINGLKLGGEEGSGTTSSLLWECKKAIEIKRPKYLMMENVKNLVGKQFKHTFDKWLDFLNSLGYTSYWKVLNGSDYGIPQARERVFVVSILNPEDEFIWPLPQKQIKCVNDFLQKPCEIPHKCYVSDVCNEEYVKNNPNLLKFAGETWDDEIVEREHVNTGKFESVGKSGKQTSYVNKVVRNFDEDFEENLFGETNDEVKTDKMYNQILQIGNIRIDRKLFKNPQQHRIYSPKGLSPTLTLMFPPLILVKENGDYKIREMTGVEELRLMGVEYEDVQKLVDIGLDNNKLYKLAGNSIIVDVMRSFYKEMIKC
ncbi:MAG: DNA (cytosine-5-)-methyltransferase [Lachnospiraceae bacterium]|nr:DNA (cytosine-5-)-methyltransferase [Lachnospiraceae bacterium]